MKNWIKKEILKYKSKSKMSFALKYVLGWHYFHLPTYYYQTWSNDQCVKASSYHASLSELSVAVTRDNGEFESGWKWFFIHHELQDGLRFLFFFWCLFLLEKKESIHMPNTDISVLKSVCRIAEDVK